MLTVGAEEEACQEGTRDAMPGAGDGAGQYGERLGSEEGAGQHCGKSCILHPYLDGKGALLGFAEASHASCIPTQ